MNVEVVAKSNEPTRFGDVEILGVFKWGNDGYYIKIDHDNSIGYNAICLTDKYANQGFILNGTEVVEPVKSKLIIYEKGE